MASPSTEYLRSPFENVFQILPQGHDKAIKHAFYNTAATLFVVFACGAAVAVYYILEAFLRPLLWAVLCGTFLHPFKNTLTSITQSWLKNLRETGTPIALGAIVMPFQVVDSVSETLGGFILSNVKLILAGSIALPAVYILYYFGPLTQIFNVLSTLFFVLYEVLGYFSAFWVWTLFIAYVLTVIFLWTPQTQQILRYLAVPVWTAVLFQLAGVAGPLRVPIAIAVVSFVIVGFVAELIKSSRETEKEETQEERQELDGQPETVQSQDSQAAAGRSDAESTSGDSSQSAVQQDVKGRPSSLRNESKSSASESATPKQPKPIPEKLNTKPRSLCDNCFIALLWGHVLVRLWKNFWIIQLVPLFLAILFIKKIGAQLGAWGKAQEKMTQYFGDFQAQFWNDSRSDVLAPKPLRGLLKLVARGDRKVVKTLEQSMDQFISIVIILLLLFGVIFFTFFAAVQVHRESMHLVTVTSNVLNNSLHPELSHWLPDGEEMHLALDSMVGNAYLYGRQWIASKVHSALNADDANKTQVQEQVLQVWDKLYETWLTRNTNASSTLVAQTSQTFGAVAAPSLASFKGNWSVSGLWDMVKHFNDFNLDIMGFVKENLHIFMSVLESIWIVLKGNLNLVFGIVTATLSMVFGGGTALLNFLLSIVIFITTLFYLLASSGNQYKPVQWFSTISLSQGGNKFGTAVEEAIGGVFAASLKMATFYGLYTWLTHTMFDIKIVFIPSALAAVFGAIPFLGTYWAAIPAILELWLVNNDATQAILLLVLHFLPTYVVDSAIYREIKGGHPYMTGLAIAGGMYWLGLEGAIIGPILLCCLIVAMSVYSSVLNSDQSSPSTPVKQGRMVDKKVKFDLKSETKDNDNLEFDQ